jgi:CRISPR-associated protein Cmr6
VSPAPLSHETTRAQWGGEGHAGLWYEKLCGTWDHSWSLRASNDERTSPKLDWLRSLTQQGGGSVGDQPLLDEYAERQRTLMLARRGRVLQLQARSSFVTGIGQAHPIENGFLWHPTLGTPYLPASGVKGALRSWLAGQGPEIVAQAGLLGLEASPHGVDPTESPGVATSEEIDELFGHAKAVGGLDLFPMLPLAPVRVLVDLVNPHQSDDFGDWNNPVPSFYLAVASSSRWQLGFVSRDPSSDASSLDRVEKWLWQAADWAGFGAKTSAGYGRFRHFADKAKPKS